jgi:hypothetical protein
MWVTAAIATSLCIALVAIVYFSIEDREERAASEEPPRPPQ